MLATMATTLSPAMALVGVIHITMLYLKAISEERYLTTIHGEAYSDYCGRVGRFVPRLTKMDDEDDQIPTRKAA